MASASVSNVTIHTAGTKAVGQGTNVWGTATGGARVQVCDQVLVQGAWRTSQCTTADSNGAYVIPLTYGAGAVGTTTVRVVAGGRTSATATVTRVAAGSKKPSSTSHDYIKDRTTHGITLRPHTSTYAGDNGVKVYLVQLALGLRPGPMDSSLGPVRGGSSMWQTTITRIKAFQKAHAGLHTDGVVDAATYYAIKDAAPAGSAIKAHDFDVDAWEQKGTVSPGASYDDRVDAMAAWAEAQVGKPYVWGGTGPMGYDCSGLLLQAVRAGGYEPTHVSNALDVQPPSKLSAAMYRATGTDFVAADANHPRKGDLIYYGSSASATGVGHVVMYIGENKVINAIGSTVKIQKYSGNMFGWSVRVGANRVR